jgi:hypothetical protein
MEKQESIHLRNGSFGGVHLAWTARKAMHAMLQMKKIDVDALQWAAE